MGFYFRCGHVLRRLKPEFSSPNLRTRQCWNYGQTKAELLHHSQEKCGTMNIGSASSFSSLSSSKAAPVLWRPTANENKTDIDTVDDLIKVQVLSWGRGSSGQLGGGKEETRYYPCPVSSLLLPCNFCLGPVPGRLSVSSSSSNSSKSHPIEVGISCGLFHSGLLVDGMLWMWGKGDGGRLGFGDETSVFKPALNKNLDGIRSMALGGLHSTALSQSGNVYTWGYGGFGALGHSIYTRELLPKSVIGPWSDSISQIATSGAHTAAISHSANSNFELGRGDNVSDWRPKQVPSLQDVKITQIACGGYHTLALTDKGEVLSWGHGGHGQLGHKSTQNQKVPLLIESLAGERVTYIACGGSSSAAITDIGKLYMWGNAKDCQLGIPAPPDVQPLPIEVKFLWGDEDLGPHHVLQVAIGASHAMCLVSRRQETLESNAAST